MWRHYMCTLHSSSTSEAFGICSMKTLVLVCVLELVLSAADALKDDPTLGSRKSPRLVTEGPIEGGFNYPEQQKHSVLFYHEDSDEMYVGGANFVWQVDMTNGSVKARYNLTTSGQEPCQEGSCENHVVTVIEKFQESLFVCGTDGVKPKCWKLFSAVGNRSYEVMGSYEGQGISPLQYSQNSLSLTVDGDLYAAAAQDSDRGSLQFRRKAGKRTNVWMSTTWVSEPTFISAAWVQQIENPDNEKIYIFFREKNSDLSPEADPWISRVARVCKVDEGGSKRLLQNIWTSFLKARLVCGFPGESLYFNHLLDVYVVHADDWNNTRVYALFSSSWNSTAVCVYTVGMIENLFETSSFKGFNKAIPSPRPGTCVKNSKVLPQSTINVVKDHPEMTDWVYSEQRAAPFHISTNAYTKIAVDQVKALDGNTYSVLLLATDSGKVHKILKSGSEAFIISETQLSNTSTLQSMKLDPKKKKLVVSFSEKVSVMDLQWCQQYNKSCAACVLARDPYCAWTKSGCALTTLGGIQNVKDGKTSVCPASNEKQPVNRAKRDTVPPPPEDVPTIHSVPGGVPFYLSCPIDSYHATYTWQHNGAHNPCLQMQSNCLHLIPAMEKHNYGVYECVSMERDYSKVVKTYELFQPQEKIESKQIPMELNDSPHNGNEGEDAAGTHANNDASSPVSQTALIILGLAVEMLH